MYPPLCDNVLSVTCVRLLVFSGTRISSTNKIDRHNIAEILLKVALNTIVLILNVQFLYNILHYRINTSSKKKSKLLTI